MQGSLLLSLLWLKPVPCTHPFQVRTQGAQSWLVPGGRRRAEHAPPRTTLGLLQQRVLAQSRPWAHLSWTEWEDMLVMGK